MKIKNKISLAALLLAFVLIVCGTWGCADLPEPSIDQPQVDQDVTEEQEQVSDNWQDFQDADMSSVPEFSGSPYIPINGNVPDFSSSDLTPESFEAYSELDNLGRCGVAIASIGQDLMPTEERGEIGQVKPSGWHTVKYDCVDGKYLYNRCHLIGFQLTGENANEKNLITGTRYLNVEGMLPFENMVADYVKETGNHVLYRVTPIYDGDNLVASGVLMEAESVEDSGEGISYNVFCYNAQPGVSIDYATGESWLDEGTDASASEAEVGNASEGEGVDPVPEPTEDVGSAGVAENVYIINTNSGKFHLPSCSSVSDMKDKNKIEFTGTREEVVNMGYEPCGSCKP